MWTPTLLSLGCFLCLNISSTEPLKESQNPTDVCKMVYFCFNGALDLRLSQIYSIFQDQKSPNQNKYRKHIRLSHLLNGLLAFLSELSRNLSKMGLFSLRLVHVRKAYHIIASIPLQQAPSSFFIQFNSVQHLSLTKITTITWCWILPYVRF